MQTRKHREPAGAGQRMIRPFGLLVGAIAVMLVAGAAATADNSPSDAQLRYRQDRAACISGQSQQDRATCLREAEAALQTAMRGGAYLRPWRNSFIHLALVFRLTANCLARPPPRRLNQRGFCGGEACGAVAVWPETALAAVLGSAGSGILGMNRLL